MSVKTFNKVFLVLVLIPAIAALMAFGKYWITGEADGGAISMVLFLPLSCYYLPPTIIFGEPLFIGGIGAGPTGFGGLIVGGVFYSLVSLIITMIYCAAKVAKEPNSEEQCFLKYVNITSQ